MIFNDKYSGDENEIFNKTKFKEFNLPDDTNYTTRSLELIYHMYCRWLNTRYGMYLVKFDLSTEDCFPVSNQSIIDYLFHRVQGDIQKRNTGPDKSIGMIWNTCLEGRSTTHKGYFLMPMTEAEMIKSPRDKEADISDDVFNIFSRIFNKYCYKVEMGIISEDAVGLDFTHSKLGEGHNAIFSNSSFIMHERGFTTLCEIAELPTVKPNIDPTLFRVRYGYNPAHNYFCTYPFKPF